MTRQPGNHDGSRGRRGDAAGKGSRSGAPRGGTGKDFGGNGGGRDGGRGRGGAPSSGSGRSGGRDFNSRDDRRDDRRDGGRDFASRDDRRAGGRDDRREGGRDFASRDDAPRGGAPKSSGYKPGAKSAGAKGGAGGQGGPGGQRGTGPRAFAGERFGLNLGEVKRRRRGPRKPVTATPRVENPDGERLQKVMAHAGVASRRVCEEMILTGRVEVNNEIVRELGVRVKPDEDTVHVDGVRIQLDESLVYFAFNKPASVVSSMKDPDGRRDISDFLREGQSERLYHVGRLDYETEGLLLLTNDGELAHRLTHPSFEVPKTYLVQVRGPFPKGVGQELRDGVLLEDGWSKVDSFKLVDSTPGHVLIEVVLHSGKNRIVRRMFDAVGFPVNRLVRLQVGPIRLGDQRQGSLRKLGKQEVGHLLAEVGL